eukprot:2742819-Rhodomonas_salina.1
MPSPTKRSFPYSPRIQTPYSSRPYLTPIRPSIPYPNAMRLPRLHLKRHSSGCKTKRRKQPQPFDELGGREWRMPCVCWLNSGEIRAGYGRMPAFGDGCAPQRRRPHQDPPPGPGSAPPT